MNSEPIGNLVGRVNQCDPEGLGRDWITYLDISSVDKESKQIVGPAQIEATAAPSRARQQVYAEDVLVSTVRPSLNAVALVPRQFHGDIASTGFCVLRAAKDRVCPQYLFYFTQTGHFVSHLTRISTGASYPAVTDNDVLETQIPLPPLSLQQRTAGQLEQADRLRRTRRYALELSDSFLPAAFLELFGDPAKERQWPLVSFGELIAIGPQNGLYKPATDYGSGTPIIRIDAYQSGEVVDFSKVKRVRLSPEEIEMYSLATGDFLINRVNSRSHLGKSTLVPRLSEPTVFESNMMRFRVDESVLVPAYALEFLQTRFLNAQIQKQAKDASNQSSINQEDVEGFSILLPPLPLQQKFASLIERHERLRATQREALRQAEHLFQTLLHRAFSQAL